MDNISERFSKCQTSFLTLFGSLNGSILILIFNVHIYFEKY
jgi:hypothetical protein